MSDADEPLQRDELVDKPGIIGARWWQESLSQTDPIARRTALRAMVGAAVGVAAVGGIVALLTRKSSSSSTSSYGSVDDYDTSQTRHALEMQRQYGWNFGAAGDPLVWDGDTTMPFSRDALANLFTDLMPASSAFRPFYVSTMVESVNAQRQIAPPADPSTFVPVKDVLVPMFTPAMGVAFRTGRALASLFDKSKVADAPDIALIVDLPGPESIAFAAGAANVFDPVLLIDNWPHPRGVVHTHLTLAAAAYFQPLFAKARATRTKTSPLFVLDRARLTSYTDDSTHFDNRFVAKMPSATRIKSLGLKYVLYVTPTSKDLLETDDLNDDLVDWARYTRDVRMVAADSFGPEGSTFSVSTSDPATPLPPTLAPAPSAAASAHGATAKDAGVAADAGAHADAGASGSGASGASPIPNPDTPQHYYGRSAATHAWFWSDYRWLSSSPNAREPAFSRPAVKYIPTPRKSSFSTGSGWSSTSSTPHPMPSEFGTIPVVVAVGTGVVIGAAMSRSGSWTRASGWGGG